MKKSLLVLGLCVALHTNAVETVWSPKGDKIKTEWADKLTPDNVWQSYPRPQLKRAEWMNMNGLWNYSVTGHDVKKKSVEYSGQILVPFAIESSLSGVMKSFLPTDKLWYKRNFTIDDKWKNKDIILHFGAVDYECKVWVNNKLVGSHKGGNNPFSFNITKYLRRNSEQIVEVSVTDPTDTESISRGKQQLNQEGIWYTPVSGIWQTVWIEPVNKNHITSIHTVPYFDDKMFGITVNSAGKQNLKVRISIIADGTVCSQATGELNKQILLQLKDIKPWSPDTPYLYDIKAELITEKGEVQDEIKSYSGMRKISLLNENGVQRLALNNEFIFQMGPLDQGYWPDGIYTAPTDEALKWDIANIKEWGFNMIRKHIKVEPQRWYYWCDKLGILVWQDMPNCFKTRNEEEKVQFETELQNMIRSYWNHPSIVNWIVFNEHWGIYDCERITENVMKLDPSRLVTGNSGIDARKPSIDYEVGHIKDNHSYRPPHVPLISSKRATVNGEYGAIGYKIEGHIWDTDGPWVHYNYKGKTEATAEYVKFINQINEYIRRGLSGAVYTQWTDVENEMNGLYTYDRKVEKLNKEKVKEANRSTYVKKEQIHGQTDSQHIQ